MVASISEFVASYYYTRGALVHYTTALYSMKIVYINWIKPYACWNKLSQTNIAEMAFCGTAYGHNTQSAPWLQLEKPNYCCQLCVCITPLLTEAVHIKSNFYFSFLLTLFKWAIIYFCHAAVKYLRKCIIGSLYQDN